MPAESRRDYYEVLGVPRDADADAIKRAYRKAALQWHPDRNPGKPEAGERFKEIAQAYQVLSDAGKRQRYDRWGHDGVEPGPSMGAGAGHEGFVSPEDLFESFFGGRGMFEEVFGGRGGGFRGRRGAHLVAAVEVTFNEMARGVEKTLRVRRRDRCDPCHGSGAKPGTSPARCQTCGGAGAVQRSTGFFSLQTTCPRCHGKGTVVKDACTRCKGEGRVVAEHEITIRIPAGIEDGTRLRVGGEGEGGEDGGAAGDLYVEVHVRPHTLFERDGPDVFCEVPVSFARAALGGDVEVPTLQGRSTLRVPPGTQGGQVLRMKGLGIPDPHGGRGRGDQLVRVLVEVPKRPTKREAELLRELEALQEEHPGEARKSFLDKVRDLFNGK
jgi:molecular chaperone DnaJ